MSVLTQFDGSMVKYIDGLVEDCGERIKQEVVFAGAWRLKTPLEVSDDGDLKRIAAAARAAGPRGAAGPRIKGAVLAFDFADGDEN